MLLNWWWFKIKHQNLLQMKHNASVNCDCNFVKTDHKWKSCQRKWEWQVEVQCTIDEVEGPGLNTCNDMRNMAKCGSSLLHWNQDAQRWTSSFNTVSIWLGNVSVRLKRKFVIHHTFMYAHHICLAHVHWTHCIAQCWVVSQQACHSNENQSALVAPDRRQLISSSTLQIQVPASYEWLCHRLWGSCNIQ